MRNLFLAILFALGVAHPADAVNLPITPQQVTATAGGAAVLGTDSGIVTTQSLTTAALTAVTFTVTSPAITPSSIVTVTVGNGTNSAGIPGLESVTLGTGIATIVVFNDHPTAALNGTLKISLIVFN
jgi:hypothetical protein